MHDEILKASSPKEWRPKVTAILPSYNAENFIHETLECLAAQTWENLEILIGDDASTDQTPKILQRFAASHDNVVVLLREENLGWLENSNDLMAKASGELMFFAFHDDVVSPDYVEKLVRALDANPDAVLAYSDVEFFQVNGASSTVIFEGVGKEKSAFARALRLGMRLQGWWVPNRGLFRSSAFPKIGGIRQSNAGEICADWVWMVDMSMIGSFVRVPEILCRKYYKDTSLSLNWGRKVISPEQWREVGKSAVLGVRNSDLSGPQKFALSAVIRGMNSLPAVQRMLPASVKTGVKAALNRITR